MRKKSSEGLTLRKVITGIEMKMDDGNSREFTAYANVKNIIDHARDRSMDGCFLQTIEKHRANKTMPSMLWGHDPHDLPVGPWLHMEEDSKGLLMRGKLSETSKGNDLYILAKDNAIDQFSIGYRIIREEKNTFDECWDIYEYDIKEVSWVNFACNEASRLQEVKSKLSSGELLTKRQLQDLLRSGLGLSKREAEKQVDTFYNPKQGIGDLIKSVEQSPLFSR